MCLQWWIEELEGMPNFCLYELEDNVWDQFGENDDHIVPHFGDRHKDQFALQGDSCKKPVEELHGFKRSTDYVSNYGTQGKEEFYLQILTKKPTMLEKGSWSNSPEGVFPSCDSDSCKEVKRLTSDDTRMSDSCYKSSNIDSSGSVLGADDNILGDKCAVEDNSICQYPINNISQTDNELSFLDNDGWLDIGNFEDVDRMFRSCDETFGLGSLNNEEEFCWLPASNGTEGSDDVLKSDFNFPCAEASSVKSISDHIDSKSQIEDPSIDISNGKTSPIDKKLRSQMDIGDDAVPCPLSVFSESDVKTGNTDNLMPKKKMQRKLSKPSEGRRTNEYLENGDSVQPYSSLKQYGDLKQPYGFMSSGITSRSSIQKHEANRDSDSLVCIQTNMPCVHPDYGHAPNQTSFLPTLSGTRCEIDGHPSHSLKESSSASNIESSHFNSLEAAALKTKEKRERLYHQHDVKPSTRRFKNDNTAITMPFHSSGSALQQVHQFENENEGHSEVEGVSIGFSQDIDSSNVQESSSMSSALDEISLEAASFCQLQQVMDQLDIRTKLCIRDSLYRLAKSAEQRHNYTNTNGSIGDDVEACKTMIAQDTSGCTGFMDMETDTNPIDRSIAHLLFHRPSDLSTLPLNDSMPFKFNAMTNGSVTNPPVKTEKQVYREEASSGVERKPLGDIWKEW